MQKKLYRSRTNRMIAGICGGLEDFTGVDATIWRLIFVLLLLPGGVPGGGGDGLPGLIPARAGSTCPG